MTNTIQDDVMLSAYIDNELDPAPRAHLEHLLSQSSALRDRLNELKQADLALGNGFNDLDQQPIPDTIQQLLQGDELLLSKLYKSQQMADDSDIDRAKDQAEIKQTISIPSWWRSAAASLVGLGLGILLSQDFSSTQDDALLTANLEPSVQLYYFLSTAPSGQQQQFGSNTVKAEFSFNHKDQSLCRQYRIQLNGQNPPSAMRGIACRSQLQWHNQMLVPAAITQNTGQYQTASNGDNMQAIDNYLEQYMQDIPMSLEQELTQLK